MTHGIVWCSHCGQPHDLSHRFCVATGKPLDTRVHRAPTKEKIASALPPEIRPKQQVSATPQNRLIGTVIDGKYRIVGRLGSGGVGEVFEAENLHLGRRVAIKMVGAATAEAVSRLRSEARAIASIHHPNICDIYDVGTLPNGQPYLVLERLVGETLHERLAHSHRLSVPTAVEIFHQLLSALHAAHVAGIVHRDLKPANVYLVDRVNCAPLVKLFDFGFALDLSGQLLSRITAHGKACGTPHYMSPEQLRGETVDVRSDVFSAGIVLFEAVVGRHPFADSTAQAVMMKILGEPCPSPRSLRASIPKEIDDVILCALQKDPKERYGSALDMQLALSGFLPAVVDDPSGGSTELPALDDGAPNSVGGDTINDALPLPRLESWPPNSNSS